MVFPLLFGEKTMSQTYRELRKAGHTAMGALLLLRQRAALRQRLDALGFSWRESRGMPVAKWTQDGFDMSARVVFDEDGWWMCGIDTVGQFSDRHVPGAIRHRRGDSRSHKWFIPVNPEYGQEDYRRACDYGTAWHYCQLLVTASKAGVVLGGSTLCGIESDSGEDFFAETALDCADQAISEARAKLMQLCGCH
jgi:hypothetical protein